MSEGESQSKSRRAVFEDVHTRFSTQPTELIFLLNSLSIDLMDTSIQSGDFFYSF